MIRYTRGLYIQHPVVRIPFIVSDRKDRRSALCDIVANYTQLCAYLSYRTGRKDCSALCDEVTNYTQLCTYFSYRKWSGTEKPLEFRDRFVSKSMYSVSREGLSRQFGCSNIS